MTVAPAAGRRRAVDISAQTPKNHVIVLFGASGDLARRKLLPGLFHLDEAGLMPSEYRIVGCSRNPLEDEEFRRFAHQAVSEFGRRPADPDGWDRFAERLTYVGTGEGLAALSQHVEHAMGDIGGEPRLLHYLSVPPKAAPGVIE